MGSSPLARGLPGLGRQRGLQNGIIPARAGFTQVAERPEGRAWDHPRSRGVYDPDLLPAIIRHGSSPLARGLHAPCRGGLCGAGIIPARAGFTWRWASTPPPRWDHPRSRGVYTARSPSRSGRDGSSPLARGLPAALLPPAAPDGIIPARAGFTYSRILGDMHHTDHPRSRGVYYYRD